MPNLAVTIRKHVQIREKRIIRWIIWFRQWAKLVNEISIRENWVEIRRRLKKDAEEIKKIGFYLSNQRGIMIGCIWLFTHFRDI